MQIHIFISGQVQGIGYRRFLQKKAKDLKLSGWVRNLADRRVEAIVKGEKENVEKLVAFAWDGPFLAEVTDIQIHHEADDQGLSDFSLLPTP